MPRWASPELLCGVDGCVYLKGHAQEFHSWSEEGQRLLTLPAGERFKRRAS